MFRHLLQSRLARVSSLVLTAGQIMMAVPVIAAEPAPPPASAIAFTPTPEAPQVTVNKTVPAVTAPPAEPQFSDAPTVEEIFRARVFAEPLVPVGGEPTAGENLVLARALLAFHRSGGTEWRSTIGDFLLTHPSSPWRAALLLNVGRLQVREHAYSRALDTWNQAWALAGTATDATGTAVADMALAEWLTLAVRSGRVDDALGGLPRLRPAAATDRRRSG